MHVSARRVRWPVTISAVLSFCASYATAVPADIDLEGEWAFVYASNWQRQDDGTPVVPEPAAFCAHVPVPGYWDDYLDRLRPQPFWSAARFNPDFIEDVFPLGNQPPDAQLLYLQGLGMYRRRVEIPQEWLGDRVTLHLGGVSLEAWIFVNGRLMTYHRGYSTAVEADVSDALVTGANDFVIAVANTRIGQWGCGIRGYQGQSGGIRGPVGLHVARQPGIAEAYVWPDERLSALTWRVDLRDGPLPENTLLHWRVKDPVNDMAVAEGDVKVASSGLSWSTDALGLKPWTDRSPELYEVEIVLKDDQGVIDATSWLFGLRRLATEGFMLRLNGHPVMLRGACECSYYPQTVTAPMDISFYRRVVNRYKDIGINWLRFHTTVPPAPYMQAADEAGIMIQIEPPHGSRDDFADADWAQVIRACRRHPSVVLYCGGNEELLDETNIATLKDWATIAGELAPDALFSPMQAMAGVEYQLDDAPGVLDEPFQHSAPRLAALQEFCDVFEPYTLLRLMQGDYTHASTLKGYGKPLLLHEAGILDSYLNLDLEHRYTWSRIGPDMFTSVRRNLTELGRIEMAPVYYAHSTAWASLIRKYILESYRRMEAVAGYDFLGGIDIHWHRTGYGVGILNEFYEFKPGETARDIVRYNGESILVTDLLMDRNRSYGSEFKHVIFASLFGSQPLAQGELVWWCDTDDGHRVAEGRAAMLDVPLGTTCPVAEAVFTVPKLPQPCKLTLHARLTGSGYDIDNAWDFYAFPAIAPRQTPVLYADETVQKLNGAHFSALQPGLPTGPDGLLLVATITPDVLRHLGNGGRVMLLGSGGLPARPTTFQINWGGRVAGNVATVIADHPLTNAMPHDGWCAWQFVNLMNGEAVVFNGLDWPFGPIVDVASSYKQMFKQSNLFEYRVGRGRLLVCTFQLQTTDTAAMYLLDTMVKYAGSDGFEPMHSISVRQVSDAANQSLHGVLEDDAADWNYDYRARQGSTP